MPFPAGAFHYNCEFAGEEMHLRFMEEFKAGRIAVCHCFEAQAAAAHAYLYQIVSRRHFHAGGIEHGNRYEAQVVGDELRLGLETCGGTCCNHTIARNFGTGSVVRHDQHSTGLIGHVFPHQAVA